jgi:hypothetical protein
MAHLQGREKGEDCPERLGTLAWFTRKHLQDFLQGKAQLLFHFQPIPDRGLTEAGFPIGDGRWFHLQESSEITLHEATREAEFFQRCHRTTPCQASRKEL